MANIPGQDPRSQMFTLQQATFDLTGDPLTSARGRAEITASMASIVNGNVGAPVVEDSIVAISDPGSFAIIRASTKIEKKGGKHFRCITIRVQGVDLIRVQAIIICKTEKGKTEQLLAEAQGGVSEGNDGGSIDAICRLYVPETKLAKGCILVARVTRYHKGDGSKPYATDPTDVSIVPPGTGVTEGS